MAYCQHGLPQPFKSALALKCSAHLVTFANDNLLDSSRRILEASSGDGGERHMESDGSVKFSYQHAAMSSSFNFLWLSFSGHNVGSLFHMADDLGRAMETLVTVMTDDKVLE